MPKKGLVMAADSDTVFAIIASFVNVDIAMADFVIADFVIADFVMAVLHRPRGDSFR